MAGYLAIYATAIGVNTTSRLGIFDISSGEIALIVGADNAVITRTNATAKWGRIGAAHYLNAEEPLGIFSSQSENGYNIIHIGGGSNTMNAATYLLFYTAANGTTVAGTERMRITEAGKVGINDNNPGEMLDVTGNINVTGVYAVDDVQVIQARVVDARVNDAINAVAWDGTTAGVLESIRDALVTHGVIAAA
jgi:hypothetical protein